MILLDNFPQTVSLRKGTDLPQIKNTLANLSHRTISSHIFEVNEHDTICKCLQILDRINTCIGHPVHVQLALYQ